ncbi:unnamed protein product [Calypogeia fissa]
MTDLSEKFNKNIRPLLDAVDRLRNLKVTSEGIPLPSIVVVGDQSSGKSSVLESLAKISLPRGQGIATRVPLVLRLERSRDSEESSITISYKDTEPKSITEDEIKSEVDAATIALAGTGKGVVTETEISLHIRKPDAPDLTMIDLPGITRVPVHGQPENIYEQIKAMIQKYLKPEETVILNVLSATVDFSTCESIRMSQEADKKGERTLAVVTKVDRAPNDVYDKVTTDDVNIGLGYICVRNQTDDDSSHEEARERERILFETHPSLSQLDKSSVGIQSLAERLTQIQANIIRMSLPGIQQQIDKALLQRQRELEALPQGVEDPTNVFLNIVDRNKTVMQDVMQNGNYDQFVDREEMHYPARLDEMFQKFSEDVHATMKKILRETKSEEILLRMTEMRGLTLPNFLSPTLMKTLVSEEIDKISEVCTDLVPQTHDYARKFVYDIIENSTSAYPNLNAAYKQDAELVLSTSQKKCTKFVRRVLDKERSNVFTINEYYMTNVEKINACVTELSSGQNPYLYQVEVEGFDGLCYSQEAVNKSNEHQSAFAMKVNLAAYCKVVHKRMADEIPLEIRYALENALLRSLWTGMLKTKMGQDLSTLMEENASTLQKRVTLRKRVDVLKECRGVLQQAF